jgi:uncharacterized membrane protein YsdA (DUF1294 family)
MAAGVSLLLWRAGLAPLYAGLIGVNVVTVALYGYDKRQAIIGRTRVPEATLHIAALLGGSPGAIVAQGLFRHKTRKRGFRIVLAAIVLLQAAAVYGYWRLVYNR